MNTELEVLQSIYPEFQIDGDHASIDIEVSFDCAATLYFETLPSLEVTHLPPVSLDLHIPKDYPEIAPPKIQLKCEWLSQERLLSLTDACLKFWQSGDEVLYSILDHLHSEAAQAFGILDFDRRATSRFRDDHRALLLLHQQLATRREFERHSFACEICLDWRSGKDCISLCADGHIFCKPCLCDMFSMHIREGSVSSVLCPSCPSSTIPNPTANELGKINRIPKATLLQIVTSVEYERYVSLLRKQELEALPSSIRCPRDFCATVLPRDPDEKLVVCTSCQLAFCAECKRTWHGPLEACKRVVYADGLGARYKALLGDSTKAGEKRLMEKLHGRKNLEKLLKDIADEELAEAWRLEHAKACPACGTYIEKAYGCNHLQCGICSVHFCFLCGDYLAANNPYPHYSDKEGACYGKLFEGLTGLEDPLGGLVV